MNITASLEIAAIIAAVVMVAIGVLKTRLPNLRSWWTVLMAAVLSYAIATAHALATPAGSAPALVEEILVIGTLAWGSSLGVAYVARAAPKQG